MHIYIPDIYKYTKHTQIPTKSTQTHTQITNQFLTLIFKRHLSSNRWNPTGRALWVTWNLEMHQHTMIDTFICVRIYICVYTYKLISAKVKHNQYFSEMIPSKLRNADLSRKSQLPVQHTCLLVCGIIYTLLPLLPYIYTCIYICIYIHIYIYMYCLLSIVYCCGCGYSMCIAISV